MRRKATICRLAGPNRPGTNAASPRVRKKSRGGRLIRTLLKLGTVLRHGDVLFEDSQIIVAVNLLPCEVLIAEPKNSIECASVAYKLGDLHVPMEISDSEMINALRWSPIPGGVSRAGHCLSNRNASFPAGASIHNPVLALANDFEALHTP